MNKTIKLLLVALGLTVAQANTTVIITPQPTVVVTQHDAQVAQAMGVVLVVGAMIHASRLHHYHTMHRHHRKHYRKPYKKHHRSGRRMRIQRG